MLRRPSSSTPKSVQMNWKWLSKQDHSSRTGKTAVLRVVGVSVRKGLNKLFLFKHQHFSRGH
jgi:hypothetical protein